MGAEKGSPIELLSVPAQQMGRVGYYYEEDSESLEKYIPRETMLSYNPYLADNVKFNMNAENVRNDKKGFVKEWMRLGLEYPATYLNAFLFNSMGFWYAGDTSHADIYGIEGTGYLMDARLWYDNKPIGIENSMCPLLRELYHKCFVENGYQKIPLVSLVFAPAFWWWGSVIAALFFWYRKKKDMLVPACFLGAYYVSLLFGPACMARYIYPIMVCVPVLWCWMGIKKRES